MKVGRIGGAVTQLKLGEIEKVTFLLCCFSIKTPAALPFSILSNRLHKLGLTQSDESLLCPLAGKPTCAALTVERGDLLLRIILLT